jgi:hypothetical protein
MEAHRQSRMKRCALWLSLITLMGVVMACGSQDARESSATALISGTVSAGPISPISRIGHPNTRPVPGARVEALHGNEVVGVVHTDHSGHYGLTLRPGTYVILATSSRYRFTRPEPKTVIASAGHSQTVDFVLDTGIR